jgi:hypothetical protein
MCDSAGRNITVVAISTLESFDLVCILVVRLTPHSGEDDGWNGY